MRDHIEYTILALSQAASQLADYNNLLSQFGTIQTNTDRITQTVSDVVTNYSTFVQRTQTYIYTNVNSSGTLLAATSETSTDGLRNWQTTWNSGSAVRTLTQTSYDAPNHHRTVTVTGPDNTQTISIYQDQQLLSVSQYNSSVSVFRDTGGTAPARK